MNSIISTIIVFFIISLINVVFGTIKSIVTVKGTTFSAAIINAVFFGFYALVVKQISETDLIITIPIIIITNFIGVYLANWILAKLKKDKIWRITANIPNFKETYQKTCSALSKEQFDYQITVQENRIVFDLFSKNQKESKIIKEIFKGYPTYVVEIEKSL